MGVRYVTLTREERLRLGVGDRDRRHANADERRRAIQREMFAAGVHPITRQPLLGSETCGTCVHRVMFGGSRRNYHKCELGKVTHGAATDLRLKWPACRSWEQRPEA